MLRKAPKRKMRNWLGGTARRRRPQLPPANFIGDISTARHGGVVPVLLAVCCGKLCRSVGWLTLAHELSLAAEPLRVVCPALVRVNASYERAMRAARVQRTLAPSPSRELTRATSFRRKGRRGIFARIFPLGGTCSEQQQQKTKNKKEKKERKKIQKEF